MKGGELVSDHLHEVRIDNTSSYWDMLMALTEAKDKNGNFIDVETFNNAGARTLWDLYQETQRRDVFLLRNPDTQRIERFARNVTVLIINTNDQTYWLEVRRIYPNGTVIEKEQDFTIRETRFPNETPEAAARRGLLEELNYRPGANETVIVPESDRINRHESSVYPGIYSIVTTHHFEVRSPWFHRSDGHVIKDDNAHTPEDTQNGLANDNWVMAIICRFSLK